MAFPTTEMAGYVDLQGRIKLALSTCQEQPWLDFKESQPWDDLRWRLIKTVIAMANLRDGGLIIIGVSERDNTWRLTGIEEDHLLTFEYDVIIDQIAKYASPHVNIQIVLHKDDDGNRYLVFDIHQFTESPVVCRKNTPEKVKFRDRLLPGDIYVRPAHGRPQTMKVTDAIAIHDLLELAAEFRARRMLEISKRVGLVPSDTSRSRYDSELASITEFPVPVKEFPFWQVTFRPESHQANLITSLTDCVRLVEKARVHLRGWDFPHWSHRSKERFHGSTSIGSYANFKGSLEYWRLFQSGQFVHFGSVREATEPQWRSKLQNQTKSHFFHREDVDWDSIPGYISLPNLVYTVTEYFEFAARICQAGVYQGILEIAIELNGVKDYVLTTDSNRRWDEYRSASENHLVNQWSISSEDLIASSKDCSLSAIIWLCECLGWISPNIEAIKKDQDKLMSRHL